MHQNERKHTVDILFVITLFCVFAISVVMLTGIGGKVYQNIVDDMTDNYNSRTSISYVLGKLHQYDSAGMISIRDESTVRIREMIGEDMYCTYLYFENGKLYEMFTHDGAEFDRSLGNEILELKGFKASEVTDTLLRFDLTMPNGKTEVLFVHLRSGSRETD